MVFTRFTFAAAALAVIAQSIAPHPAAAQAVREGPSFTAASGYGTVRLPDVAYDAYNGIYLTVSGNNTAGRFVSSDGVPLGGQFAVSTSATHNQAARVVYSPDMRAFLVTWFDTRVNPNLYQVWGRFVRYTAGGAPQFVTSDFIIGAPAGGANGELGMDVAYSSPSQRFLVVYNQIGPPIADVVGQFVDTYGNLVGGPMPLSLDNHWQREPSVAYDTRNDRFMVAWGIYYNPAGPGAVHVRTVQARTGALGTVHEIATGSSVYVPQVEFNDQSGQFFVAWYTQPSVWGRTIAPDGTPLGAVSLLAYNYATYDGLGLSYNNQANAYFAVFHGRGTEDVGTQITAGGQPESEITVTATAVRNGNYNPRLTSHLDRREWLVVTSSDFGALTGQRVRSLGGAPPPPPPPPPDVIELTGPSVPNGSWFFAEGAASTVANGFSTFYLVQNANPVAVAMRAYYVTEAGQVVTKQYTLPARSRVTLSLAAEAGAGTFSTVFQSQTARYDISVERAMYYGPNFEVSTSERATDRISTVWMFAEGSRGGELFDNFILLFNPYNAAASITVSYMRADGVQIDRHYTLGPRRRLTLAANEVRELAGRDFAILVQSDVGILSERAMYWRPVGSPVGTPWVGGHVAVGTTYPNNNWYFAEGAAANNFETFYLLYNPRSTPVTVYANFFTELYGLVQRVYVVQPGRRETIYLNGELGPIGGAAASLTANQPFVAERSIYWGAGRVEGTNTLGVNGMAYRWELPEGAGGPFETFLLLGNPFDSPAVVELSLQIENYGQVTLPVSLRKVVPRWGRTTLYMPQIMREAEIAEGLPPGTLANSSFATTVRVVSGPPIVAEHAVYMGRAGADFWRTGSAAFGTPR